MGNLEDTNGQREKNIRKIKVWKSERKKCVTFLVMQVVYNVIKPVLVDEIGLTRNKEDIHPEAKCMYIKPRVHESIA